MEPHLYEALSPDRQLSEAEQALVWRKSASHRTSAEERRICREVRRNWRRGEMKIATILLEGDAGSGKTQLAKALSADFGLPYTKVTCFADMDKTDVIGAILPVIADDRLARLSPEDREALQALYDSDGFQSASRLLTDKLRLSPEAASYRMKRLLQLAQEQTDGDAVEYRFYPSEIVNAYRNGYLLEIQEPTVIRDAAVLMALNSALEPDGSINLPTEVVRRHPDFIAVITTNRGYAGVRPLNEALRDRVQHAERMDLPDKDAMIERAEAKTGYRNRRVLATLADVILLLDQTARAHAIKGVAGMRSFFYWTDAVAAGAGVTTSLYPKVVYKLTTDPEEIKLLEAALEQRGLFAALAGAEAEAAAGREAVLEPDQEAEPEQEAEAARPAAENGRERHKPQRRTDAEAVEIHTWGAVEVESELQEQTDAEGIALKKAAGSEEGSAGALIAPADGESSENGDDGEPRYHQANPETMPAEDAVRRRREERAQLNREAREAVAESPHGRVKLVVHRPDFDEAGRNEYERMSRELLPVVREIARKALPLLEQEPTAEFARHHAYGSRFQADAVAHRDFNAFAKKRPPTDSPSLAVALRVDESASMAAFGRLEAAKRAVIAVYDFCRMCGIPVMIYGDTADVSRLEQMSVFAYADLKRLDPDDRYRLMGIRARSNNRDGMALRIIAERLAASPQSTKLLISLSDGQPKAMEDYAGSVAMRDMRQTIAEFERKGVTMLAAAIGQDKEIISRIYGNERFLDITDLQALPAKLVGLIAKYL
ncbi:AAA domain-containing protein [Paenibacillus lycopersici]|uniref:AAA domain-containing protein n=1 Tax=Paenibacillus lycopersici TaxID=2704462 RepID=A0A6C0FWG4_9BACL|nr:AAA family ATPase [Paenibacillus lycopersici]QHT61458.1 AAA domain-containing protein [Paenibacillus lycopersici]